MKKKKEKFP